jgi:Malonate decarboxylase, alpha subunit, transporter
VTIKKQADFLAACLAKADPKVLHDLHVVQSGIVLLLISGLTIRRPL